MKWFIFKILINLSSALVHVMDLCLLSSKPLPDMTDDHLQQLLTKPSSNALHCIVLLDEIFES